MLYATKEFKKSTSKPSHVMEVYGFLSGRIDCSTGSPFEQPFFKYKINSYKNLKMIFHFFVNNFPSNKECNTMCKFSMQYC